MERNRRYAERIETIFLLDQGELYKDIAKFLFINEWTIGNYKRRYERGRIEGLINDDYINKRCFLRERESLSSYQEIWGQRFFQHQRLLFYTLRGFLV